MNNQQRKSIKMAGKGFRDQIVFIRLQHFLRNFLKYKVIFSHTKYARIITRQTALEMTKGDCPLIKLNNESVCDGPSLIYVETSKMVICMQHAR